MTNPTITTDRRPNAALSRAVIYSRISDDPTGKAAGVGRQEADCRTLADSAGVEVVEVLVDNDLSATTGKRRPGFERVLEMLRAGDVDTVICWHTDRLYRLPRDLEPIIDLAADRPLRFLTVMSSEIDLNTASGRMVARMLAAASAQEVEHKAERQRSASDQRAARGMPTARPGFGYRRVGAIDIVNEDEAALILEIVDRLLAGESLRGVSADLNRRGIPSPSGAAPWVSATLRQMVRRPSLAGLRTHRGDVVGEFDPAAHPRILDVDVHHRLVALFDDPTRKKSTGGRAPRHLLSGLARCGLCGGKVRQLVGRVNTSASGETKRQPSAYACMDCFRVRRQQIPTDDLVTELVLRRLERDDAADLFARGDAEAVTLARNAIAALDARMSTAADLFAAGTIDGAQLARISAQLRDDRTTHEAALAAALPPALPADAIGPRAREVWGRLSLDQQRALIEALMAVTILPQGSGRAFDPELIRIDWVTEGGR